MFFGPKYAPAGSPERSAAPAEVAGVQCLAKTRYRCRAFGERFTTYGNDPARRDPTFQQRTYDAGLRIYDYRNRSYDPSTGRFLQRDPVLGGDSLYNPYVFPGNNPVGNLDPMGLGWLELQPPSGKFVWVPEKVQTPKDKPERYNRRERPTKTPSQADQLRR